MGRGQRSRDAASAAAISSDELRRRLHRRGDASETPGWAENPLADRARYIENPASDEDVLVVCAAHEITTIMCWPWLRQGPERDSPKWEPRLSVVCDPEPRFALTGEGSETIRLARGTPVTLDNLIAAANKQARKHKRDGWWTQSSLDTVVLDRETILHAVRAHRDARRRS